MKKIYLFLTALLLTITGMAQVPDAINFQAIARDANGDIMPNTTIQLRLTVIDGSPSGTEIYQELRALTTNEYGSFSFQIGRNPNYVTIGAFTDIIWEAGNKFLKIDYDPTNTFNWDLTLGTIELVTVPYAFAAGAVTYIDLTGVQNGDILVYNSSTGKFEPSPITDPVIYWSDIINKPNFANVATSGDYNDLYNLPTLFDGNWNSLTGTPPNISIFNNDAGYITSETDDQTLDLTGNTLSIEDANNVVFTDWDTDVTNDFSGSYTDLTNIPVNIDEDKTDDVTLDGIQNIIGKKTFSDSIKANNGINVNSKNITNLANPINNKDAVNKEYVDMMISIMENNGLAIVDFVSDEQLVYVNNPVIFTDKSAINPTSWYWDFGDGNTSTIQNPSHTYTVEGTYTVSLTASNDLMSKMETKTDYITITGVIYGGGVTDYDGNSYTTVIVGNQEWMAENLKVTHYPDGTPIPNVNNDTDWNNLSPNNTDDAYCWYNDDILNKDVYGALYTWAAAMGDNAVSSSANPSGVQGVCPDGWHLPSDDEFKEMEMFAGMSIEEVDVIGGGRGTDEGNKLKEIGTTHWIAPNDGINTYGFTALPGGFRSNTDGSFEYLGLHGSWWSTTDDSILVEIRELYNTSSMIASWGGYKSSGYSVRCVKD